MGMIVNTNTAANNAYRNLNNTQKALSSSMEKLSSGLRINRAADDAAGLSISQGLKSQVNGYQVAARNAQDGINVIQTAEGGLNGAQNILQRMRDLAVQAGNDSNNTAARTAISTEAGQLSDELDRLGKSTNFNGINLLDGSANLKFQVGAGSGQSNQISMDLSGVDLSSMASGLKASSTGTQFNVAAFDTGTGAPSGLNASYSFTSSTAGGSKTATVDLSANTYTNVDAFAADLNKNADFSASFSATVVKDGNGAGIGVVVTAKDGGTVKATDAAGADAKGGFVDSTGTAVGSGVVGLDFSTSVGAQKAIDLLDTKIAAVSAARSNIGAVQNRLNSAIDTLNVGQENLSAAASSITDVDMASEMAKFTKDNILSQAGTAMLAQANQSSQSVLKLLG
ncbi:flagellin [Arthrobacter wenxiniae]|jgi:flagellin|uniref:Flagellin n=1 Tax=Arthrobacter wenxiniae TaxID=2713570 RepID=A0A7Y7IJF5_9MICC|nr:flagellin [Arthrobacter wenxiniae]NVM96240.1 flagellin [Arthrobacter wenxiniae]